MTTLVKGLVRLPCQLNALLKFGNGPSLLTSGGHWPWRGSEAWGTPVTWPWAVTRLAGSSGQGRCVRELLVERGGEASGSQEEQKHCVQNLQVWRSAPAALRKGATSPTQLLRAGGAPDGSVAGRRGGPGGRGWREVSSQGWDSGCRPGPGLPTPSKSCCPSPSPSPPCLVMAIYTKHQYPCLYQF